MYVRTPLFILIYAICLITISIAFGQSNKNTNGKCEPLMFDCGNNFCIPRSWRCDGDTDCLNGNDEKSCPSSNEVCDDKTQFKCKEVANHDETAGLRWRSLSQLFPASCIPKGWKCDGEFDCPEKDDEADCDDIKCTEDQFKCKGFLHSAPSCIPMSWRCDGQTDCVDGTDEKNCTTTETTHGCKSDEFRCNDGQCIFASWKCDTEFDCKDKSDEADCGNVTACDPKTHFKCDTSNFCLPINWTCDGTPDCPDHSDEKNCTEFKPVHVVNCHDDEFMCFNKAECVRKTWVCDGDYDCSDKSDEANCTESDKKCGVDEDLCDDGICREDCNVHLVKPYCDEQRHYRCSNNHTCIAYKDLCTTPQFDCPETVCNRKIMQCDASKDNNYCFCHDSSADGKVCYCSDGFQLQGRSCVDIDECQQPGICDQKCVNLVGTYYCDCYPGFKLTGGQTIEGGYKKSSKCRAIGSDPLLFLSNRASIRQYDLITNKYHPLVNKLESAVAMDYWHANKTLIWSDVSKEQIMKCTMKENGDKIFECAGDAVVLIDKNISTPDGLAVDWVHGLLFWTDTGLDTISVYDLKTNMRKVLFNTSLEEPRAIAVDPSAGLIFWTDWGSHGKIERAGMDGNNRIEILSGKDIMWPNGIALDIYDQRVYWADAKTKTISSCDYWGQNVRTVLHSHKYLKHPFSLTVFEERIYWTDWDNEGIMSVNKFNGQEFKPVMDGVSGPMTVRIYHEMAQPNQTNKCEMHSCEHICLPRALIREADQGKENAGKLQGLPYKCTCAMGFRVSLSDWTQCVDEELLGLPIMNTIDDSPGGHALSFFFIIGLIVSAVLIVGYIYRQRRFNKFTALNFENPIYRRTVEEVDGDLEIFGDNTVGAIPVNPGNQEPRLVISNSAAAQYTNERAAYMDNDPINHHGLY
uniref:EGF-like domain-containing protein n=1 Tax=Panagrolaimus sp. JU765 TaxID=591449 RepID=A0AC34R6H9_9BILA